MEEVLRRVRRWHGTHAVEAYEKYLQKCHEVRADDVRAGVETTRFSQHGHVVAEK